MAEHQSVSSQHEAGDSLRHEGLPAASDDLGAVVEHYSRLNVDEIVSPGERRRLNDVAEALRRSVEEDTNDAALPLQAPPPEGLLAPAAGEAIPLPPEHG